MNKNKSLGLLVFSILLVAIIVSACSPKVEIEEPQPIKVEKITDGEEDIEGGSEQEDLLDLSDNESLEVDEEISEVLDGLEESSEEGLKEEIESPLPSPSPEKEPAKVDEKPSEEVKVPEESQEPVVKEEVPLKKNALKLEGKIDEVAFSLDELKGMTDIIFEGSFYSLNNFGTTKHNTFKGVNLWKLLSKNNISSDASSVSIVATDGYEMEFSIDAVKRQDYIDETDPSVKLPMIIAWSQDGENFDLNEGPPYKLIIGQREAGDINKPQWVSNIDKIIIK